jgi:hypothetical protein
MAAHDLISPSACPSGDAPTPKTTRIKKAPSQAGPALTEFERTLVSPMLDDIRAGVRPFADGTVGICEGQGKTCDAFLGTDPGSLDAGKYMLRGEFRAPKLGEKGTWKVQLETKCVTTKKTASGESSTTDNRTREYDVVYAGEERGYRLSPMVKIDSPSQNGAVACTYVLTSLHPDAPTTIEGGWQVPSAK